MWAARWRNGLVLGMAVLAVGAGSAAAQRAALREVTTWGMAGASLALAVPVGEFDAHVGAGGGLDAFLAVHLDPAGITALRLDGSFLAYGRANDVAYLDGTFYSIPVGVTTTSYIVSFRGGPQLTLGTGPLRLYGFGQAGFSHFATTTSFGGYDCGCSSFADITEHDDLNFAMEAGGGLLVKLGRGRRGVLLDLGARYLRNGQARYLPASQVGSVAPLQSQANLVMITMGISVPLR
jgi:hypothetical protein